MTRPCMLQRVARGSWRGPFLPFAVGRLGAAILSSLVLIATLPLLFVQQPSLLEPDLEVPARTGRPQRAMSPAERDAIRALMDYRACIGGVTVAEFIETAIRRGESNGGPAWWPGGPSWPTSSYAVESNTYPGSFSVYVPYRISGVPYRTEVTFMLSYDAEMGIVGGALTDEGHLIDLPYLLRASCSSK